MSGVIFLLALFATLASFVVSSANGEPHASRPLSVAWRQAIQVIILA